MSHKLFKVISVAACTVLGCAGGLPARAAGCTTQAQMTAAVRDTLANTAHGLLADMQSGNMQALQQGTIPSLAANFSGLANSITNLKPEIQSATITVDNLYLLDASDNPAAPSATDFYCGSPVVSLHFGNLPRGTYALAILHATGVPHPQQFSLILSQNNGQWLLGGFFVKPMLTAGHDGVWYWKNARNYAQAKDAWPAWLYYQTASNLLDPLSFLSSPNLQMLHQEADKIRPATFPDQHPMVLTVGGVNYTVNAVGTTTAFGGLDLDVRYAPDSAEAEQLSNPPMARQQVTAIMSALVELHPGLKQAFHGIWVHAQQGSASLFALELPMQTIASTPPPQAAEAVGP
ncbi:MAG TPA: hypothetical protein VGS10_17480 [Terracidiphilus sp.]|nr:hypothetical protein [Terracidiphilus sp.]